LEHNVVVGPVSGFPRPCDPEDHDWERQADFVYRSLPPKYMEVCGHCGMRRLVSPGHPELTPELYASDSHWIGRGESPLSHASVRKCL